MMITCHERLQTVMEFFSRLLERPTGVVACAGVVEAGNEPSHRASTSQSVMVRVDTHNHQTVDLSHTNSLTNEDHNWLNNSTTQSQTSTIKSQTAHTAKKSTTPIFMNKLIGRGET